MSILKAKWELGEPNIASAQAKNDKGLCANHECNNLFSNPAATGYGGLKVCDICRKNVDRLLDEIQRQLFEHTRDYLFSIIEE